MEEFDAPQEHGVKQLRETVERKDEQLKKMEAELASFKDKELDNVFSKLGLQTDKGFGKALKQVYNGPVDTESIAQFAKDEYGFEAGGTATAQPQTEEVPVAQDDARARVAALDANSRSEVPIDVMDQLDKIVAGGDPKASIRARLSLLDQQEKK